MAETGQHLPRGGIGRKLVRTTVISVTLTVLALGGLTTWTAYQLVRNHADVAQRTALDWSAEPLRELVSSSGAWIEARARSETLRDHASADARDDLGPWLARQRPQSAGLTGLMLLTPEGGFGATAGEGAAWHALLTALKPKSAVKSDLLEAMHSADLRRVLASIDATSIQILEPAGSAPLAIVSAPVSDAAGRRLGTLHGLLDPARLAGSLRPSPLGGSGSVRLLDSEGRVLAVDGVDAGDALASGVTDATDRHAHLIRNPDEDWTSWKLASALPIEGLGWTLMAQQSMGSALAPLLVAAPLAALAGGLLILGSGVLAALVAQRAVRPLTALAAATRRLMAGDFDVQLPAQRMAGQVAQVFHAFNAMAARLQAEHERRESNLRALSEQNRAFQKEHQVLSRMSVTDGLTDLNNHRYFQDQLRREVKRLSRTGQGLSMLIIDIDDFKQLNDTYGHAAGDEFLKQLAQILKESVRETDLLARYGGEEFVVVATNSRGPGALLLAEKLRTRVAESSFIVDSSMRPRRMTVSIGVAEFKGDRTALFAAADAALYRAKSAGKNCAVLDGHDSTLA